MIIGYARVSTQGQLKEGIIVNGPNFDKVSKEF